jgi:hypothetical protein
MDLSSTELFVEILLSGILFAIGMQPILILVIPRGGYWAIRLFMNEQKWLSILIFVAMIYPLGVGGNRIAEVTCKKFGDVIFYKQRPDLQQNLCNGLTEEQRAEIKIRAANDTAATDWLERHKSYRKLLRAGSASATIFIVCIFLRLLLKIFIEVPNINHSTHKI